jgi:hypothetical protein
MGGKTANRTQHLDLEPGVGVRVQNGERENDYRGHAAHFSCQ